MTQSEIDNRNVKLLKKGYFLTSLPNGQMQLNKTEAKMAEAVAYREAYTADFNRRMNMPDPVLQTDDASWLVQILAVLGIART
jgi:hypothetical protein